MGRIRLELWLLQLCALAAADIVYVTDLPQYASLAGCAQTAVSEKIQGLTNSACPQATAALESCACSKDNNAASIASAISSAVLGNCASTASDDVTSASAVFSRYCNQGSPAPTITPAPTLVSQYISEISAYSNLAPCAQSGLSTAVLYLTEYLCPTGQSALQSCACTKNQNSLAVSENINSQIFEYCASTASEDVTSAQAIFAGYCGLGNGTTSFPAPGTISGTVTYYITDLPLYSSLAPCAATAISNVVLYLTTSDCQSAHSALASCACYKNQNSAAVSKAIISSVRAECASTASADITSAIGVFDFYCSAAGGKVVASGVTASEAVATAGSAATSSGNPRPVGTASSPGSSATAAGGSGGGSTGGSSSGSSSAPGSGPSPTNTASSNGPLIGGIVGGVGAVALIGIGLIVWFCRRKRRSNATLSAVAISSPNKESKADLELHQYSKMPTPPLKPQNGAFEVPAVQGISEMPNQNAYSPGKGKYSSPSQYTKMSSPSTHTVSPITDAGGRPNVPEIGDQPSVPPIDGRPGVPEMPYNPGRPGIPEMPYNSRHPGVPEMPYNSGRPGVPEMPYNPGRPGVPEMAASAGPYQTQHQSGYPNQVYEMAPGQYQQQQQQHGMQPRSVSSHNNAGPIHEMYTPDPR